MSASIFTNYKIETITDISADTKLLRIALPNPLDVLPLPPCSHIQVQAANTVRKYTPVHSDKGFIDLLVKRYENGIVSSFLHACKVGDSVMLKGPFFSYKHTSNKYAHLTMISGGTAITPMFQVPF